MRILRSVWLLALCACAPSRPAPNVLWIVWDTVRADHLGLYGYPRPTTPNLEAWAEDARVFEDCLAVANSTVPSHAAMFTGLLPSEHGANDANPWLDESHQTLAELFRDQGYQTFLWSANPHVSSAENFQQGFDVASHPWDEEQRDKASRIVRRKLTEGADERQRVPLARIRDDSWAIKAAGELAQESLEAWLAERDPERPFLAFLNYMEAHSPTIPPKRLRERMMGEKRAARSYGLDVSWLQRWAYTFGLREYTEDELEILVATYDAAIAELDELFGELMRSLEAGGHLENTIVVLTADHGEHLGEKHMLDHQYTLYGPVLRVPLVLRYPPRVPPGRETQPVMNHDLFTTLLDLAGIERPAGVPRRSVSLLRPDASRARMAELPSVFLRPIGTVKKAHPDWDPGGWSNRKRALHEGGYKLIRREDGHEELYDLSGDPGEENPLGPEADEVRQRLGEMLEDLVDDLRPPTTSEARPPVPEELQRMLEGLGYGGG
jgi:arylsulfatase A-like enzyme